MTLFASCPAALTSTPPLLCISLASFGHLQYILCRLLIISRSLNPNKKLTTIKSQNLSSHKIKSLKKKEKTDLLTCAWRTIKGAIRRHKTNTLVLNSDVTDSTIVKPTGPETEIQLNSHPGDDIHRMWFPSKKCCLPLMMTVCQKIHIF